MQYIIRLVQVAILSLISFLSSSQVMAGKFYKCTDENGEIQYQQVACTSTTAQDTIRVYTEPEHRSQMGASLMGKSEYTPEGSEPALANRLKFQSGLTQVLGLLTPLKFAVIEFYMMNGNWPESPKAMGFNQENLNSSQIEQVLMGDQGAIVAWLGKEFGTGKKIVIAPKSVMDGTSFEWQCLANFPAQAMSFSGTTLCESRSSH
ncbi:MAG: pilin [Candidatus Thiodiazotropha sp. (ex Lucinoma borealis)]|nr:pilin [Candidatus Thiodiazotropha sp. (ex Lucinoma borealis)]